MKQTYLAIHVPDDQLVGAIAEEAQLRDLDLDHVEKELASRTVDPARAAALALTVGRAGRPSSRDALGAARASLIVRGHDQEAQAVELALEILQPRPPACIERAERGYRRVDPRTSAELFIEDPLAAHWHHVRRWGPPLRAELDAPIVEADRSAEVDRFARELREGKVVVVRFLPPWWLPRRAADGLAMLEETIEASAPTFPLGLVAGRRVLRDLDRPLYVTQAGLARDASLHPMVRWSELGSVGVVERGGRFHAGYEPRGTGAPVLLPDHPSIPVEDLVDLMTRLLRQARA